MPLNYPFLLRSVFWSGCSIYLWRSALFPNYGGPGRPLGKTDRVLRVVGALITLWLAVVAIVRGCGLF